MASTFLYHLLYRRSLRRAKRWRHRARLCRLPSGTVQPLRRVAATSGWVEQAAAPLAAISATDVFSLPELCAIILRPARHELSDLKAVATIASTSAVCTTWHAAVASSAVWRSACMARWPSTSQMPLALTTDYRRLYQSRAVAQRLEPPAIRRGAGCDLGSEHKTLLADRAADPCGLDPARARRHLLPARDAISRRASHCFQMPRPWRVSCCAGVHVCMGVARPRATPVCPTFCATFVTAT
jgi:hypothetical protein